MKKTLALILAIFMLLLLCACGEENENNQESNKNGTIARTPEEVIQNVVTMNCSYLENCNWYGFNLSSTLSNRLYSSFYEDYNGSFDKFKKEMLLEFEDIFTNSADNIRTAREAGGELMEIDCESIGEDKINSFRKKMERSSTVDELISSIVDFSIIAYSIRDENNEVDSEINISTISKRLLVGDEYSEVYKLLIDSFDENIDEGWVYLFTPSGVTNIYATSFYINAYGVSELCDETVYVLETDSGCFGFFPYH